MKKFKVFLADDHPALRDSLARTLNASKLFSIVGVASNGREVVTAFENGIQADIILLDLSMPVMDGYATTQWLTDNRPEVKILIMTLEVEPGKMGDLLSLGVGGIVHKDIETPELLIALETVAAGELYYNSSAKSTVVDFLLNKQKVEEKQKELNLSDDQLMFIRLTAAGLSNKEIDDRMKKSRGTVDELRKKVWATLNVDCKMRMVVFAVREGLAG